MNKETLHSSRNSRLIGIWYAIAAFTLWGFLPLYWKSLKHVPAFEILAHRILWSFVFVFILLLFSGRWRQLKGILTNKSKRLAVFISSLLISINWFIYIWAVNANHVVEASLGYYINPLISIALGMIFLKERLNFWQLISLMLAIIGVSVITLQFGQVPWIAITLALTFGVYGLSKKVANLDAITGLTLETLFVVPVALIYIVFIQANGTGALGVSSIFTTLLLIGAGIATATPLLWFAQAASRVPLSTIGFAQYLAPSISLFLGVVVFKESFTTSHLLSFGFIWLALFLYSFSKTSLLISNQPKFFKKASLVEQLKR